METRSGEKTTTSAARGRRGPQSEYVKLVAEDNQEVFIPLEDALLSPTLFRMMTPLPKKAKTEDQKTEDQRAKTEDKETKTEDEETKTEDEETKTEDQEAKTEDQETKTEDQEAKIEDQEAKTEDQETKTEDQEAKTEDQKAKTEDQKAKTEDPEEEDANVIHLPAVSLPLLCRACEFLHYKNKYAGSSHEVPDFPVHPDMAVGILYLADFLQC